MSEPPKKKIKSADQRFRQAYTEKWPCLRADSNSPHDAFCTVCSCSFSVKHGGYYDCSRHISAKKHQTLSKIKSETRPLAEILVKKDDAVLKTTKAEMLFTAFLVEHNLPLSAADHASALFKDMFPDSEIAKSYSCARTKSTAILKCMAEKTVSDVILALRSSQFSVATDGSTDQNINKLYPIVVRYFDFNKQKIVSSLLSILECSDNTGYGIFSVLNQEMERKEIPWKNCVAFGCDNASTMIGHLNGVAAHIKKINSDIHVQGCICHLLHICAQKASQELKCEVDSLLLDIYYYLDKSSKRKKKLLDCQKMFELGTYKFLKYVSTRWLSLLDALNRLLSQWDAVVELFLSLEESSERVKNVKRLLECPSTKLYLYFLQSTLPLFTTLNTKLQSEAPLIHLARRYLYSFLTDLFARFTKPAAMKDFLSDLTKLNYHKRQHQKANEDLIVGSKTRAYMTAASLSETDKENFYNHVRKFYEAACTYAIKKLPFLSELLQHAEVADPALRESASFNSVKYFVNRFKGIISNDKLDDLEIEFSRYQIEEFETDILSSNADVAWAKISSLKDGDGALKYKLLPKVILTILLLPQSNAASERVFSIVKKNLNEFRPCLNSETLNALMIEKINMLNNYKCYERNFSDDDLLKAKHATVLHLKSK